MRGELLRAFSTDAEQAREESWGYLSFSPESRRPVDSVCDGAEASAPRNALQPEHGILSGFPYETGHYEGADTEKSSGK